MVPQHEVMPVFPLHMVRGHIDLPLDDIIHYTREVVAHYKNIDSDPRRNYTSYFDPDFLSDMKKQSWFNYFANTMKDMYVHHIRTFYNQDVNHLCRHDIEFFPWLNRYDNTDHHSVHNHVGAHMAGTLYVKTENAAPITFINPALETIFSHDTIDEPRMRDEGLEEVGCEGHTSLLKFKPKDGEFLMWPAYMQHYIEKIEDPEDLDYERITISFNMRHRVNFDDNVRQTGDNLEYNGAFR